MSERIDVQGAVPRADAVEWLRAADAVVLSSDWENFPHAAVEALAAGTPVIATAVGGVPEIIQSGVNGLLVPRGDERAFGAAMASLAADTALTQKLRAGAQASADCCAGDRVDAQIEGELAEAARAAQRGRQHRPGYAWRR